MSGGWWCCCGCTTYEDDFERPDSTTIGGSWVECSGDSEIVDGRLYIPSGGKVALNEMAAPVDEEVGIFYMECETYQSSPSPSTHTGTEYRITAFWGTDGTPCGGKQGDTYSVAAEIASGSPGGTIQINARLYKNEMQIGSDQLFTTNSQIITLVLCVSKHELVGYIEEASPSVPMWTCPDDEYGVDGRYFLMETRGGDGYVEWAKYSDHYDHDTACPDCDAQCCCTCLEDTLDRGMRTLVANIYAPGTTGAFGDENCDDMDGAELELWCDGIDFECCNWNNDTAEFNFECNNDGVTYKMDFTMQCGSPYSECDDYIGTLTWDTADNTCCDETSTPVGGIVTESFLPISVSCECEVNDLTDEVSLTFGPFALYHETTASDFGPLGNPLTCAYGCKCCSEFYIVVTTGEDRDGGGIAAQGISEGAISG